MGHEKKKRLFKFSTIEAKETFMRELKSLENSGRSQKKYKHSVEIFQFVESEVPFFFIRDALVSRVGSINPPYKDKLLAITNWPDTGHWTLTACYRKAVCGWAKKVIFTLHTHV